MKSSKETVFVGLSGGVDSSVAAYRLLKSGKRVVGVFIKTWQPDFIECTWKRERLDAMRVAAALDIPFTTCDATDAYKTAVADYMIREYKEGKTPNPDVMCNEQVKFGTFYEFARSYGVDAIATGHYAQTSITNNHLILKRGIDTEKDQSYFLWKISKDVLKHVYFPVGNARKKQIRIEAKRARIPTHAKKDSQGVCFLGTVNMEDFLAHYVPRKQGLVIDMQGTTIGTHTGALFYTLGQRHGFNVHTNTSDGKPLYVVDRDITANTITVDTKLRTIAHDQITLRSTNFFNEIPGSPVYAQYRYRQTPFPVKIDVRDKLIQIKSLDDSVEKPSHGQSCVLYTGDICHGGGIIEYD
jgi:tRNA-uridine 2-sulfurtransferase